VLYVAVIKPRSTFFLTFQGVLLLDDESAQKRWMKLSFIHLQTTHRKILEIALVALARIGFAGRFFLYAALQQTLLVGRLKH
jgi:hypothetical protein